MTISNMLCKHLGRELIVESEENKGTTFTFWVKCDNGDGSPFKKRGLNMGDRSRSFRDLTRLIPHPKLSRVPKVVAAAAEPSEESENLVSEFAGEKEIKEVIRSRPKKSMTSLGSATHESLSRQDTRKTLRSSQKTNETIQKYLKQQSSFADRHNKRKTMGVVTSAESKELALETPKLLARRLNRLPKLSSPITKASVEFEDITASSEQAKQITALSFVPGKNQALNQEFLADHVGNLRRRMENVPRPKKVYHNAMAHLNHLCDCPIVLIVDDNEINKIALTGMLQRFGLKYREGSNGKDALKILAEENCKQCCKGIRLVLMDCDMPVMDGITASKEIKKLAQEGKIAEPTVVAVTAYHGTSIEKECLDAGMKEYMSKPVEIEKLFDCIQRHLTL